MNLYPHRLTIRFAELDVRNAIVQESWPKGYFHLQANAKIFPTTPFSALLPEYLVVHGT